MDSDESSDNEQPPASGGTSTGKASRISLPAVTWVSSLGFLMSLTALVLAVLVALGVIQHTSTSSATQTLEAAAFDATGGSEPSRFVGGTSNAPTTGAHEAGDFAIDAAGVLWICTTAGTPGTWKVVAGSGGSSSGNSTSAISSDLDMTGHAITNTTDLAVSGLPGSATSSRYVGATSGGAPVTGTYLTGDWVVDETANIYWCTQGGTPGTWVTNTPPGVILAFGGITAPAGWLMCDGSEYVRSDYPRLWAAIGSAYGSANSLKFNVPDLRGQFLRGVTGQSTNDPDASSRTAMAAGGNVGNNVGSVQASALMQHTHSVAGQGNWSDGTQRDKFCFSADTGTAGTINTAASTGGSASETRPTNCYANFIIRT